MVQQRTRRAKTRRARSTTLAAAFLALSLVLAGLVGVRGQDLLRQTLITPSNAQAIQLYADNIVTWSDSGERVFVLKGQVAVEQGLISLRMPDAVVWVDEKSKETNGAYRVAIYGESGVTLDNGPGRQTSETAYVQLATSGELRIKSFAAPVMQGDPVGNALVQRAAQVRASQPPPPTAPPLLAAKPAPAMLPAEMAAVPLAPPLGPLPLDSGIQQVQALQPAPPPAAVVPGPGLPPVVVPSAPPGAALAAPPAKPPRPAVGDTSGISRRFSIRPRGTQGMSYSSDVINGETVIIVPTGVIISIGDPNEPKGFLDIEADRMVLWTKGNPQQIFTKMQSSQGETANNVEFYLTGNVEIRTQTKSKLGPVQQTLRADEVYYDVGRNVAIALKSDFEINDPKVPNPIHFQADEFFRLNAMLYETGRVQVFSTTLPSDPGLKVEVRQATIEERDQQKKNIFGISFNDPETGQPKEVKEHYFKGRDMVVRIEGVPVFYFPYIAGLVEDPLGPLNSVSFGVNRAYGFHILTTWDVFDLIGVEKPVGSRWHLLIDYLSARGPAAGSEFQSAGHDLFGIENHYETHILGWGIYDTGTDILGGGRGQRIFLTPKLVAPVDHPDWRGRFLGNLNLQELPYGFSVQTQLALLSDHNFLEQYYKSEFDDGLNQETFLYVKQQQEQWAWTLLAEPRLRHWVTETAWLPRADGYLIGQKFGDLFTYNAHANVGYAELFPAEEPAFPYAKTDKRTNTGRFDLWQDLSLPFQAGPFKLVPYGVLDLMYYSEDLNGDNQGRIYGGGGLRASIPFSKLYPGVCSDLFNLDSIYHKIVFSGNWYYADTNTRMTSLPQLDRLEDDASDQALRDIFPRQPQFNPANAAFLTTSPIFDPQFYALRRLIFNRVDTLDRIDVIQLDLRQRWQTKRGMPGNEHVIDWMTLDLGMSIFPEDDRDNFGRTLGILEYDWLWNIGDRTALLSNGWMETIDGGPRVFNAGVAFNRPDNTNLYLGYRQIDPLESRAVVASLSYAFSAKYAASASTVWDFGTQNRSYAITLTRIGTDMRTSFGLSYNSTVNSFGVQFEIVPNLLGGGGRHNAFAPELLGPLAGAHH